MSDIVVGAEGLAIVLAAHNQRVMIAGEKASRAAALRLVYHLRKKTDEMGITDLGGYKDGFKADFNVVYNDAPHAEWIENGVRPHPVSRAGVERIAEWVRRKLRVITPAGKRRKVKADEAMSIAYAIAAKIKKHGQAGHYVMASSLGMASQFFVIEFARIMKKVTQGQAP